MWRKLELLPPLQTSIIKASAITSLIQVNKWLLANSRLYLEWIQAFILLSALTKDMISLNRTSLPRQCGRHLGNTLHDRLTLTQQMKWHAFSWFGLTINATRLNPDNTPHFSQAQLYLVENQLHHSDLSAPPPRCWCAAVGSSVSWGRWQGEGRRSSERTPMTGYQI